MSEIEEIKLVVLRSNNKTEELPMTNLQAYFEAEFQKGADKTINDIQKIYGDSKSEQEFAKRVISKFDLDQTT